MHHIPSAVASLPKQPDGLTLYFILSVVLVNCLIALVAWHEIFYNVSEPWSKTIMAIGQGIGISVAVTIVVFADLEAIVLISERYRKKRYYEGVEKEREAQRKRRAEAYERFGVYMDGVRVLPDTPEVQEFLEGQDE